MCWLHACSDVTTSVSRYHSAVSSSSSTSLVSEWRLHGCHRQQQLQRLQCVLLCAGCVCLALRKADTVRDSLNTGSAARVLTCSQAMRGLFFSHCSAADLSEVLWLSRGQEGLHATCPTQYVLVHLKAGRGTACLRAARHTQACAHEARVV